VSSQIETFISCAKEVIRDVTPIAARVAGDPDAVVTTKSDGSLVTTTDTMVEQRLLESFGRALPECPVLGEEGAIDQSQGRELTPTLVYSGLFSSACQIIVDPIDGTKNFVEGKSEFCIAAALTFRVAGGIWPQAAVVAIPKEGRLLWCDGSSAHQEDLQTGHVTPVSRSASAATLISVNSRDRAWLASEGYSLQAPWVSSGSSIYDLLGTATGRLRGSVVGAQRLWDLVAPLAVASSLGMVLRDLQSGEEITALTQSDLSTDVANRPWGLARRMVLLPRDLAIHDVVTI